MPRRAFTPPFFLLHPGSRDTEKVDLVVLDTSSWSYAEQEYFVGSKTRRRFREMLEQDLEEEMGCPRTGPDNDETDPQPKQDDEEICLVIQRARKEASASQDDCEH